MSQIVKKKTVCPLDCPDSCGMIAIVKNGRVTALQGDKHHPYTNGFICRKMRRYPERFYGDTRLLYPQIRVGEKGSGEFKRVNWDEALKLVSARLLEIHNKYGGESILPYSYAGNMGAVNRFAGYPLFHKLGTSRLDQTICSAAAGAGWKYQCSTLPGSPPENCAGAQLIIAWGINIKVSNVHFWQYVAAARKRGARLIVIDPYKNQTAKSADMYLPVLPGGDSSLALGLAKSIIEKKLLRNHPAQGCGGFDEWQNYLCGLDWEVVTRQSGISREMIEGLAKELAGQEKTFVRIGIGLTRNSRGGMAVRAISALGGLLGLYGGGSGRGILLSTGAFKGDSAKLMYPELSPGPTRLVNMIHLGRALNNLSPPVRALVVYNSNPASVCPDSSQVRRGLQREDLFTVVHEQVMTPTARYADVLLPATTFLENQDIYTAYGHFYLGVSQPVVRPYGEARSNFDFFQQLAQRMGFDDPPFKQSCKERLIDYLESLEGLPKGYERDALMSGKALLSTNSYTDGVPEGWQQSFRFVHAAEYTTPTLPSITNGGESEDPDLLSRFPFRLITPPHPDLLNSTFGEFFVDRLGELLVHPSDAKSVGIEDGDAVIVENLRGKSKRTARLTEDTRRGVVVAEGIFWTEPKNPEKFDQTGGINDLTSQKPSDMGGGATFHESMVRIRLYKAEAN